MRSMFTFVVALLGGMPKAFGGKNVSEKGDLLKGEM